MIIDTTIIFLVKLIKIITQPKGTARFEVPYPFCAAYLQGILIFSWQFRNSCARKFKTNDNQPDESRESLFVNPSAV